MTSPERQPRPSTEGAYLDPSARRALGHTAQLTLEDLAVVAIQQGVRIAVAQQKVDRITEVLYPRSLGRRGRKDYLKIPPKSPYLTVTDIKTKL